MKSDDITLPSEAVTVIFGDTLRNADLRHEVPIAVGDPLIYIDNGTRRTIFCFAIDVPLFGSVEEAEVVSFDELLAPTSRRGLDRYAYFSALLVKACSREGVTLARVPAEFPYALAKALRAEGVRTVADEKYFAERRRRKTDPELDGIRRAGKAAEAAWSVLRDLLRSREPITSEELHAAFVAEAATHGMIPQEKVICPHGSQSAIGHGVGSGRVVEGEPIIADLVLRDRITGCYADVTRTFCVGMPPDELAEYASICAEVLDAVIAAIGPGTMAAEANDIASGIFERAGYPTLRNHHSHTPMDRGATHWIGHGVGLEVHEPPLLGAGVAVPLVEGEVFAIEPGLYRSGFGGCRLEDLILVTASGCERLTWSSYSLNDGV